MKKRITDNELKQIEIQLLDCLDRFCARNGLKYYLAYGTLIGAVRHKGFIPWDDDIDVIMPRQDYDSLVSSFNENTDEPNIKLMHHSIDTRYYLPIAKLVDSSTVLKEDIDSDYEIGVYIDIFPLDNLAEKIGEARKRMKGGYRLNKLLMLKTMKWRKGRSIEKNLLLMCGKAMLIGKSLSRILEDLEKYCCETKRSHLSKYVGIISGVSKGDDSRVFQKEWFESSKPVEFEGCKYPAPIGADEFLRKIYGDYMQLPPVEQQVTHHSFEAWFKEQ